LLAVLPCAPAFAHHGAVTSPILYETDELVELEGELTETFWRNPHTRAKMKVVDEDGNETIWELELGPGPRQFEHMGVLAQDLLGHVRAAGYVSRKNPHSLGVTNFLLPSGQEYLQGRNRTLRWSSVQLVDVVPKPDKAAVEADRLSANGIFRMWGRRSGRPLDGPVNAQPLTEQGKKLAAAFDPIADNLQLVCQHGMPDTMFDPVPMEISDEGDQIRIHVAQYNIQRIVHMKVEKPENEIQSSPVGYSVGRWDGDALVVATTHVDWPYYLNSGTPQSDQVRYDERFSISTDGQTLNYSLTISDPVVFAGPFTLERTREWTPGVEIESFNCVADWAEEAGGDKNQSGPLSP
jgi:hypothetical protein